MQTAYQSISLLLTNINSSIQALSALENTELVNCLHKNEAEFFTLFKIGASCDAAKYKHILGSYIQNLASPPHLTCLQNPMDSDFYYYLEKHIREKHFQDQSVAMAIESLFNDFMVYFVELIKSPYSMVGADDFNKCEHFVFFNKVHLHPNKTSILPKLHVDLNDGLIDYSCSPHLVFGNIPIHIKSHDLDVDGGRLIMRLCFYFFLREKLMHNPNLIHFNFLFSKIYAKFNTQKASKFHPKFCYYLSRVLSTLRIIYLKRPSMEFYKVYRGEARVLLEEHIARCGFIERHAEPLERWREFDSRMYFFFIRQTIEPNNFAYFSPTALKTEFCLHDKKSARALLKTNNTLFETFTSAMVGQSYSNGARFLLHWMAYTTKHLKPNSYCVMGLLYRLNRSQVLSDTLLQNYPVQCVRLMDLLYECALQVWGKYKVRSAQFFQSIQGNENIDSIFEYLSVTNSDNFDADIDAEYSVIVNLSNFHKKTTLESLFRAIKKAHKGSTHTPLDYCEYSISFKSEKIDGFTFTHIHNTAALMEERTEMQHCIAIYNNLIKHNLYAAFKVEGNNQRATLGVFVRRRRKSMFQTFIMDQCKGPCDVQVSPELSAAVDKFMLQIESLEVDTPDPEGLPFVD